MLSSSERSVQGLAILVKEEKNGYYIGKWTRSLYTMQCVSVRLDIKVFTMLLVYYKTLLAFSTANFYEERSNNLMWEISKTYYLIGQVVYFGRVYKGFKFKRKQLTLILQLFEYYLASLSLSLTFIAREETRFKFTRTL